MKVYIKDRIKFGLLLLLPLLIIGYFALPVITKTGETGVIISARVIDENNTKLIESWNAYPDSCKIILKTRENNKFYLQNSKALNDRYELTEKQFNELKDDEIYWIDVRLIKNNELKQGNVKRIYTDDPS